MVSLPSFGIDFSGLIGLTPYKSYTVNVTGRVVYEPDGSERFEIDHWEVAYEPTGKRKEFAIGEW